MTFSAATGLGLALTPVLISAGQVLFKMAGLRLNARPDKGVLGTLVDPYLLLALVIYGAGTVLWVYVLSRMPLRHAYPVMALTYLLVPVASIVVFEEVITWSYWFGAGLVVAGVVFMVSSA